MANLRTSIRVFQRSAVGVCSLTCLCCIFLPELLALRKAAHTDQSQTSRSGATHDGTSKHPVPETSASGKKAKAKKSKPPPPVVPLAQASGAMERGATSTSTTTSGALAGASSSRLWIVQFDRWLRSFVIRSTIVEKGANMAHPNPCETGEAPLLSTTKDSFHVMTGGGTEGYLCRTRRGSAARPYGRSAMSPLRQVFHPLRPNTL